jgi:hypothetical protein
MKLNWFSFFVFVLAFGVFAPLNVAFSQTAESPAMSTPPVMEGDGVTVMRDQYAGDYNFATIESLSKLYWRLGAFDIADDEAIANYIKINDCKIYVEYLKDDFEWKKILGAMREHITQSSPSFPTDFQFLIPVNLGKYDTERGGFPIINKTGFEDSSRIQVTSLDANNKVCSEDKFVKDYPKGLVLLLKTPLDLNFIKVDEHVAQAYILRQKSEAATNTSSSRAEDDDRIAYVRMRVSFSQYLGPVEGTSTEMPKLAILEGTLHGYEVFEDPEMKRMMLSVDFRGLPQSQSQSPPIYDQGAVEQGASELPQTPIPVGHSFSP